MTIWQAIPYVGSGLSLVAFIVAAISLAYRAKLKRNSEVIKSAPSKDRVTAIATAAEFFNVDLSDVDPSQKIEIVLEQIRNRAAREKYVAVTLIAVAILLAIIAIVGLALNRSGESAKVADAGRQNPIAGLIDKANESKPALLINENTNVPLPPVPTSAKNGSQLSAVPSPANVQNVDSDHEIAPSVQDKQIAAVSQLRTAIATGDASANKSGPVAAKYSDYWNDPPKADLNPFIRNSCYSGSFWYKTKHGWDVLNSASSPGPDTQYSFLWHGESPPKDLEIRITKLTWSPYKGVVFQTGGAVLWDRARWPDGGRFHCFTQNDGATTRFGYRINFTLPNLPAGDYQMWSAVDPAHGYGDASPFSINAQNAR